MNEPLVLVLGSANLDLVAYASKLPAPGETILAERLTQSPGGKGANQAIAAARAGARTIFVGAVGVDGFAKPIIDSLRTAGIELGYLRRVEDEPTGLALITVDADGRNLITVVPGANVTVGADDVERVRPLLGPNAVVIMQLEIPIQAVTAMADAARRAGATVILNPAPAQFLPADVLGHVDVLVPNEHELRALVGQDRISIAEASASLIGAGVGSVVVTLGPDGASIVEPHGGKFVRGHRVPAVDTTGAGDALIGAMAARLALGDSLADGVRFGNASAALSVQRIGAQSSMPLAQEVEEFLRQDRAH